MSYDLPKHKKKVYFIVKFQDLIIMTQNKEEEFLYSCYPCLQSREKKKTTSKSYGNLLKHVKKYHKSIYFDKKHYGKKPVKSMAIYCELKNCIRKSFKKSSGYQCFKNCPFIQ